MRKIPLESPSEEKKVQKILFRETVEFPSTTYATFGLYRYPAKFIPQVVAFVLENYGRTGMRIFDPFAGCGTAGLVSRIYGYDYEMWDLNPLLEILHSVAIMEPSVCDVRTVVEEISRSEKEFIPDWPRIEYWFPENVLTFLYRVWGYYHSVQDKQLKLLITVPLLKVTRFFSYDDVQRQKLSRSPKSIKRVTSLLSTEWKGKFFELLKYEIEKVLVRLQEYQRLSPKNTKYTIRAGVDVMKEDLVEESDILITSPPYLQSQEYIRQAKPDLFWLGYSSEEIKKLSNLEIPYRDVTPHPVYSETFFRCESQIEEDHIRRTFRRYFQGVLGALSWLEKKISSYLFLFVGHSSTRGKAVPIDQIFVEHFEALGWKHEKTLVDTIVNRRLFSYRVNPATGIKDARTTVENLVVLRRG